MIVLRVPEGTGARLARAARISAVEDLDDRIKELDIERAKLLKSRDYAFWDAQRQGVEIRLLSVLTGLTVQAIYQGIERAKKREEEADEEDRRPAG